MPLNWERLSARSNWHRYAEGRCCVPIQCRKQGLPTLPRWRGPDHRCGLSVTNYHAASINALPGNRVTEPVCRTQHTAGLTPIAINHRHACRPPVSGHRQRSAEMVVRRPGTSSGDSCIHDNARKHGLQATVIPVQRSGWPPGSVVGHKTSRSVGRRNRSVHRGQQPGPLLVL